MCEKNLVPIRVVIGFANSPTLEESRPTPIYATLRLPREFIQHYPEGEERATRRLLNEPFPESEPECLKQ